MLKSTLMLSDFKRKINIKYFMVAYLGSLFVFSALLQRLPTYLLAGIAIVILYASFDLLWTRVRDHVWYLPVSSLISGFVLSNVALFNPSLTMVVVLPLLAVSSKQLLHFGKNRHVLNPAGFSMTILNLVTPAVSWWSVSWGLLPLVVVSIAGLFILWRQSRWHVSLTFLGAFSLCFALFSVMGGSDFAGVLKSLPAFLVSGQILFFSTVMLIEPVTSGFPTWRNRVTYGALIGFFAAAVSACLRFIPQIQLDPLLVGLLLGNLSASLLFLPPRVSPTT